MNIKALALVATFASGIMAQPAMAQEEAGVSEENGTSFRGFRVEGNIGVDRFRSEGVRNDEFGYGATIGFDGTIGERIVIGPEVSYWRAEGWNENCSGLAGGNTICHKALEEFGGAVRAGFLVSPKLMVFGKGGFVYGEQRRRIDDPAGTRLVYDHDRAGGYQLGGGAEYTVMQGSTPVYVNAQYVYSQYNGNSSRQRVMAGVGIRFR